MKKITFLVAAMLATTMAVNANVIEIANFNWIADADTTSKQADQTVEKDGVTLKFNGTILDATYNNETYRTLRVYAGKTLTVSCAEKITKIEVIGYAKQGANITASAGTVDGGSFSENTYAYENGFDEPLFVINDVNATSTVITPVKQIRLYGIRVTTSEGGETPDEGDEGDEAIELTVNYAQAVYFADYSEEGEYNWEFDLFNVTSDNDYDVLMYIDLTTPTQTKIAGDWNVDNGLTTEYSGLQLINGKDTTELDATDVTLKLTCVGKEESYLLYNVAATMVCDNGKTYTVNESLIVYAFDYDTEDEITLVDDVTAIRNVEVMNDVYANAGRIYAEEGARIYTVTGLDVTRMNGSLNGIYIVKAGNKVGKIVVR